MATRFGKKNLEACNQNIIIIALQKLFNNNSKPKSHENKNSRKLQITVITVSAFLSRLINLFLLCYIHTCTQSNCITFIYLFSGVEDNRLDGQHMTGLYGHRSNSSASSSPPAAGTGAASNGTNGAASGMLVVPQPINAAKMGGGGSSTGGGHHIGQNGTTGRKYQCKMCPQVSHLLSS